MTAKLEETAMCHCEEQRDEAISKLWYRSVKVALHFATLAIKDPLARMTVS